MKRMWREKRIPKKKHRRLLKTSFHPQLSQRSIKTKDGWMVWLPCYYFFLYFSLVFCYLLFWSCLSAIKSTYSFWNEWNGQPYPGQMNTKICMKIVIEVKKKQHVWLARVLHLFLYPNIKCVIIKKHNDDVTFFLDMVYCPIKIKANKKLGSLNVLIKSSTFFFFLLRMFISISAHKLFETEYF